MRGKWGNGKEGGGKREREGEEEEGRFNGKKYIYKMKDVKVWERERQKKKIRKLIINLDKK